MGIWPQASKRIILNSLMIKREEDAIRPILYFQALPCPAKM
nr:MAG TPA: hypothetical protein [Caudoviricetes sp.]